MSKFIVNLFGIPAEPNWKTVYQNKYVCSDKKSEYIFSKYLPGVNIPDRCDKTLYSQVIDAEEYTSPAGHTQELE